MKHDIRSWTTYWYSNSGRRRYFKDLKSNKKQEVVVEEIKESKKPYPLRCLVQFSKSFKKSRVNREMKNKEVKYWVNYKAIKVC